MKMIDVSKVRVFRGSLFVLLMLFMRIGWASNDDSTYNICLLYTSDAADE